MLTFASEKEFQNWAKTKNNNLKTQATKKHVKKAVIKRPQCIITPGQAEFFFYNIHPSTNQYMRWHWTKRADEVTQWHWLTKQALGGRRIFIPEPIIETTYFFPDHQERDRGNYIPKFIIDALVKERIIEDDSSRKLNETMPVFIYGSDKPGMLVMVKGAA